MSKIIIISLIAVATSNLTETQTDWQPFLDTVFNLYSIEHVQQEVTPPARPICDHAPVSKSEQYPIPLSTTIYRVRTDELLRKGVIISSNKNWRTCQVSLWGLHVRDHGQEELDNAISCPLPGSPKYSHVAGDGTKCDHNVPDYDCQWLSTRTTSADLCCAHETVVHYDPISESCVVTGYTIPNCTEAAKSGVIRTAFRRAEFTPISSKCELDILAQNISCHLLSITKTASKKRILKCQDVAYELTDQRVQCHNRSYFSTSTGELLSFNSGESMLMAHDAKFVETIKNFDKEKIEGAFEDERTATGYEERLRLAIWNLEESTRINLVKLKCKAEELGWIVASNLKTVDPFSANEFARKTDTFFWVWMKNGRIGAHPLISRKWSKYLVSEGTLRLMDNNSRLFCLSSVHPAFAHEPPCQPLSFPIKIGANIIQNDGSVSIAAKESLWAAINNDPPTLARNLLHSVHHAIFLDSPGSHISLTMSERLKGVEGSVESLIPTNPLFEYLHWRFGWLAYPIGFLIIAFASTVLLGLLYCFVKTWCKPVRSAAKALDSVELKPLRKRGPEIH